MRYLSYLNPIDVKKSLGHSKMKWVKSHFSIRYKMPVVFGMITLGLFILVVHPGYNGYEIGPVIGFVTFFMLLILSLVATHHNDKLIPIALNKKALNYRALIEDELKEAGWRIDRANQQYLLADKNGKWVVGSTICILFDKHNVLVNVQNSQGYQGYAPFSFGRNKRIMNWLIQTIKELAIL